MNVPLLAWLLFVVLTPSSTSVLGPMSSKEDCENVQKQMRELKPVRMGCVEVPIYGETHR